jgi:hypothetical protein
MHFWPVFCLFVFCFFAVLGFELALGRQAFYCLPHSSTSPISVLCIFEVGSCGLALNLDPLDLCLLSSQDYRSEPPVPG